MRRPLKYQLLLPWLAVTLATVVSLSIAGAWLASVRVRSDLRQSLRTIAATLIDARFPVEDSVLHQASGLTGARFAAADIDGRVRAVSDAELALPSESPPATAPLSIDLDETSKLGDETYFHAVVELDRRKFGGRHELLHIFYPQRVLQEARWQAVWPPLLVGSIATLLLVVVTTVLAGRVTRPIEQLGRHAEKIAAGEFASIEVPQRNDELRDLVIAINRMTAMLARYEEEVRRSERLRTLGQLGGGVAHQIRNAVTGCRIALDLHVREQKVSDDPDDPLSVARRQLELIENYVKRFLTLGRTQAAPREACDVGEIVMNAASLIRPTADHLQVSLHVETPAAPLRLEGDRTALEQMLVNLIVNGVESASREKEGEVQVSLQEVASGVAQIDVIDSGRGIAESIRGRLFEPFASEKPDGVGLGLCVARDIARSHQGDVVLVQMEQPTRFRVTLPLGNAAKMES